MSRWLIGDGRAFLYYFHFLHLLQQLA